MSNLEVETAGKLDITSSKASSSCGSTPQGRRCRSFSAATILNRNSNVDSATSSRTALPASNHDTVVVAPPPSAGFFGGNSSVKRRHGSFSAGNSSNKRRKKSSGMVPPTKFLLGGNITDPLNLSSFADETGHSPNHLTPESSPLPLPRSRTEVEVLIPPNINDPLNLNASEEDVELELISPSTRKKHKRKKRKRDRSKEDLGISKNLDKLLEANAELSNKAKNNFKTGSTVDLPQQLDAPLSIVVPHKHKKIEDKIVSPVIPQPGARRHRPSVHSRGIASDAGPSQPKTKKLVDGQGQSSDHKEKDARFRYGNYDRYYGYRNPGNVADDRLGCLKLGWFEGKDVLDVGCNIGHITLSVARDFRPRKIIGIDIDETLVKAARRNISHYITDNTTKHNKFPISFSICCGPIATATLSTGDAPSFPNNVCFVAGNYVLESDELLELQKPEFDVVLCLSLTKWVHLNWGDEGVRRLFKRIYRQLKPGGMLILEAQSYKSYGRRKKMTEATLKNYQGITLYPEKFAEYLLSKEVGFAKCEKIGTPNHTFKGFQRPMQLFTKAS